VRRYLGLEVGFVQLCHVRGGMGGKHDAEGAHHRAERCRRHRLNAWPLRDRVFLESP